MPGNYVNRYIFIKVKKLILRLEDEVKKISYQLTDFNMNINKNKFHSRFH